MTTEVIIKTNINHNYQVEVDFIGSENKVVSTDTFDSTKGEYSFVLHDAKAVAIRELHESNSYARISNVTVFNDSTESCILEVTKRNILESISVVLSANDKVETVNHSGNLIYLLTSVVAGIAGKEHALCVLDDLKKVINELPKFENN